MLFVNDDPIAAYDTAEGIINVIGRDPRMPDVRVGLASGSVVTRLGDVAIIPYEPVAYLDPADGGDVRLVCRHGSLTPEEMLVPLVAGAGRLGS